MAGSFHLTPEIGVIAEGDMDGAQHLFIFQHGAVEGGASVGADAQLRDVAAGAAGFLQHGVEGFGFFAAFHLYGFTLLHGNADGLREQTDAAHGRIVNEDPFGSAFQRRDIGFAGGKITESAGSIVNAAIVFADTPF